MICVAGVLNPVELCLVNKGFKKSEKHLLSAIQELRISSISADTDGSSSSSLASLELQLFEDPHHTNIHRKIQLSFVHSLSLAFSTLSAVDNFCYLYLFHSTYIFNVSVSWFVFEPAKFSALKTMDVPTQPKVRSFLTLSRFTNHSVALRFCLE